MRYTEPMLLRVERGFIYDKNGSKICRVIKHECGKISLGFKNKGKKEIIVDLKDLFIKANEAV